MTVPVTTMNKDNFFPGSEYKVWFPRKIRSMQPKANAHRMDESAHNQFRGSILTSNGPHICAAAFYRYLVHSIDMASFSQGVNLGCFLGLI
jgi:hypothetical protein